MVGKKSVKKGAPGAHKNTKGKPSESKSSRAILAAPRYSAAWKSAIRNTQIRSVGAWGASVISGDPESVTLRYNWSRILTRDSVCTEADFETCRLANIPTSNPCGYAVAVDITGYDEWSSPTQGTTSYFRPAETQIYHIDMAHIRGRSLEHRVKWSACVPAVETRAGLEYPVTIAPVEQTTYPDVSPSNTKNLSFGHTLKPSDRRMTFYKRYTDPSASVARYRKYMVVGVYSPLSCNGASAGSDDVGSVDITLQCRAFSEQSEMAGGYSKVPLPMVIDYPIYDPAELEGPLGDDTSTLITIVVSSNVKIKPGTTGKYYVYVDEHALDDVPRGMALYKLERPLMINVATTSGGSPQPCALQYFRYGAMAGGETSDQGYLFSSLFDAMEFQPSTGYATTTTIQTTYPVRMIKEVDASGIATARGRGLGNVINVSHNGLTAPRLKRVQNTNKMLLGAKQPRGFDISHPQVVTPDAVLMPRGNGPDKQ